MSAARLYIHQLRGEQLLFWRTREAAIFTFAFPILLFLLLGAVYTGEIQGHPAGRYLLAGLLGYGVGTTAFAGLAITICVRRENGVLKRVRATPLPPVIYIAAILSSTLLVFALETVVMVALARGAFHVGVPHALGSLALEVLLGVVCFAALGAGITAAIRSAEGSSAILNVVLLPMAFLSGSFGPTRSYPHFLRVIADVLPLTYLLKLIKATVISGDAIWEHPGAIGVVLAWGAIGVVAALSWFRWEPRST
jgi:ABC-2 type transport system permease protein